ncbi:hypothetical protein DL764_007653 [Monosporascus ibericus]|uniref:Uncharacterized protein n=1 Tax=Monosporascus ibericus TaxID=155417 RepID=A0A4Q4SZG8_9PEZI|nr:hypothetical protein DL764_007653 [Monosporascus ibericus]
MATVLPPPSKRQKKEVAERARVQQDVTPASTESGSIRARFVNKDGEQMTDLVEVLVADATEKNISLMLNTLLGRDREEFIPYRFRIQVPGSDAVIAGFPSDFLELLRKNGIADPFESMLTVTAEEQAIFKVQAVSRMSHRIPGHGQPILCTQFSPASDSLATGSGDNTARIWDIATGTPKWTLKGHTGWVLGVSWSPDGDWLATCSMDRTVRIWDPTTGKPAGREFKGHSQPVLMLAWQPYHLWQSGEGARLASCSKDATVRIWVRATGRTEHVLSGHAGSVTCVRWGGTNQIYTASHDKTVRVWDAEKGTLVHNLKLHAHWINSLALSTDFALRTGFFDHTNSVPPSFEAKRQKARERFEKAAMVKGKVVERLVSASDDFTMYLWDPINAGTKPVARLQGHQRQVNSVRFSPDATLIASAGWDNHVKLWGAQDGKFLGTLRGHVAPVYTCEFSADSRLLVTGSKDTTLKVWNVNNFKLARDLPGHEDEVYAVDWSPDGRTVASGGKDKALRTWRN